MFATEQRLPPSEVEQHRTASAELGGISYGCSHVERQPRCILPFRAMTPHILADMLEDPFEILPVQGVLLQIRSAQNDSEDSLYAKMGPWGVSRRFWSVEEEHWEQRVGLLIGAAFVLSQAAVTQSTSLVRRLRRDTAIACIPESREAILSWKADTHEESGISKLLIVDAGANYFKHHHEWPEDWGSTKGSRAQQHTMAVLRKLGLGPGHITGNMHALVRSLDLGVEGLPAVADSIQSWRERVATEVRHLLSVNGI